ncbi:MAG: RNA polymerase subunit sigma [Bacteroidetes bacterium]|nr:RNA polymerase subunit sigma [Bacteroidota bacterium]
MDSTELIPQLFRTEYRKVVAVLCKHFGFDQIAIAEDIASDAFLTAAETWGQKGLPPNPTAWLYTVAANRAKNYLKRRRVFDAKLAPQLRRSASDGATEDIEVEFSPQNINDSQLRMMFAISHPAIPPEAQVGLSLRILCGFGIDEIAEAFLTNKEVINKRLFRAKEKIREAGISLDLPGPAEIEARLGAVLTTIYLLFNEGYYSAGDNRSLRKELCFEAIRLCQMLIENVPEESKVFGEVLTNTPEANALLALMCFHASRLDARLDANGEIVLYEEQDVGLWNSDLVSKGGYFLNRSASGDRLSKYHLEAGIAYWNTQKEDTEEKWTRILQLYDILLQREYSPMAALNRTYAYSKVHGKEGAIREALALGLENNRYFYVLLGDLYTSVDDERALSNLSAALALARTPAESTSLQKRIDGLVKQE